MPKVNGYKIGPKAKLQGANLRETDLSNTDLRGADLRNADLFDTNLQDADLSNANLTGASLGLAYLSGADLRGADLTHAELGMTPLMGAIWDSTTKWPKGFTPPPSKTRNKAKPITQAEAAWHPDPLGRYQYRYWEGTEWSGHVSTNGVTAWDPLEA